MQQQSNQTFRQMSPKYTKRVLKVCSARELTVLIAAFGVQQVADRLEIDISALMQKTETNNSNSQ